MSKLLKSLGKVVAVTMRVAIDDLKPATWNPDIRVQLRYIKDLRDSIETNGFFEFEPILVDKNGVIIDGHRRWTAAKQVGLTEVPVIIVDDDADRIWAILNGTRMDLSGQQVLQAVSRGLKSRPAKYASMINRLTDLVGEDVVKQLGRRGVSPFVVNQAMRIARYCLLDQDKEFLQKTVLWLTSYARMNTITTRAIRESVDSKVIEKAIRGDKPLSATYG
jgi:ParB/RepB/Spo0J family partition protein